MSNTPPCSHMIGKSESQASHPLTPSPPTPPRAKHIHISHTPPTPLIPCTTHIPSMSAALSTILEPHIQTTCPAFTTTTPPPSPHQHCRHTHTLTHSQHTHMQHKQQYKLHSHSNYRIHIGYQAILTDRPNTTT